MKVYDNLNIYQTSCGWLLVARDGRWRRRGILKTSGKRWMRHRLTEAGEMHRSCYEEKLKAIDLLRKRMQ